jgi:threonine/homoserine/homoserine lactone efflux protein
MSLFGLLLFAGVYLAAVATPGPGVALVIARALGRGLNGLGWFIAGFVVGDIILMSLALSGLAFIAETYALAFEIVKYVGVAYLLWMAWQIWRAPVKETEIDPRTVPERPWKAFLSSLSLTLGNPKAIFFFLSIMPLVVDVAALDLTSFAALVGVIIVVMPPVFAAFAVLADRARRVFRSGRALRRINKGTAVMMAGAAAAIARS